MVLQAFFDDSGSEPQSRYFVLGGFVSTAEKWATFSGHWQAELDGGKENDPPLEYFKAAEASALRKQFSQRRGWTAEKRNRKVVALAEIVREAGMARVAGYLRNDFFEKHLKTIPVPERRLGSDNPYLLLLYNVVIAVGVRGPTVAGLQPPCDFTFDRQLGFEDEALRFWPSLRIAAFRNRRADMAAWVQQPPCFRDDKVCLPLQAADLYAWHCRRAIRDNEVIWMPPPRALQVLEPLAEISREMSEAELIRLRDHLLKEGPQIVAKERPGTPLVHASKGAPKRARNAAKKAGMTAREASNENR